MGPPELAVEVHRPHFLNALVKMVGIPVEQPEEPALLLYPVRSPPVNEPERNGGVRKDVVVDMRELDAVVHDRRLRGPSGGFDPCRADKQVSVDLRAHVPVVQIHRKLSDASVGVPHIVEVVIADHRSHQGGIAAEVDRAHVGALFDAPEQLVVLDDHIVRAHMDHLMIAVVQTVMADHHAEPVGGDPGRIGGLVAVDGVDLAVCDLALRRPERPSVAALHADPSVCRVVHLTVLHPDPVRAGKDESLCGSMRGGAVRNRDAGGIR